MPRAAWRGRWQAAIARLRGSGVRIVEGTAAATLAWLIAIHLLSHPAPFFAAAAALIAMGVTRGQRIRRAGEVVVGVALGVLAADLLARALAPHLTLTVLLITVLTLTVATLLDGSPILAVQAAVSGIYVAVVASPADGLVPGRFLDALVGGTVALAVNQLPKPRSLPNRLDQGAAPVFDEIAAILDDIAAVLVDHDVEAARSVLQRARLLDAAVSGFEALAAVEAELVRFDPVRRRQRDVLRTYEHLARQLDLTARNVRVLARASVFLTRASAPAPRGLAPAVATLARAVRHLSELSAESRNSEPAPAGEAVVATSLEAIRIAAGALQESRDVPVVMIVGQVRATAVDVMLGAGMDLQQVLSAADDALGISDPRTAGDP